MRRRLTVLIAIAVLGWLAFELARSGQRVPERSALVIELEGTLQERPAMSWLEQLRSRGPALPTLLLQLEKAAADERVEAVLLRMRGLSAGFAQMKELREAVQVLAVTKPVIAWLDLASLNATRELYLASAARQVYVAPGYLGPLAGLVGQFVFLRGFLEHIGVSVEATRVGAYKSATETFTQDSMSEQAREQTDALLDGIFAELVGGIARGRRLEPAQVQTLIDAAPGTAQELIDAALADAIASEEEVLERAGFGALEELPYARYAALDPGDFGLRSGPRIALVIAEGTIASQSLGPEGGFTPERIGEALDQAAEDDSIRAIVLRINSGGGSSQASEAIWQRVVAARQKKPVIASLGDTAASGGYYVASGASRIVAESTTLTGSIGVFLLRPSFGELLEKLRIRTEFVRRGRFAGLALADRNLEEAERQRLDGLVAAQYSLFLERVAAGRPLEKAEVDAVAQGRVWLGSRARELELVDELGGLARAVEMAKAEAGIPADVDPERVLLPGPEDLQTQLRGLLRSSVGELWAGAGAPLVQELPGWLHSSALLLGEIVYLPPVWVELR
jgi:protease-4